MPDPSSLFVRQPGLLRRTQTGTPIYWASAISPQMLVVGVAYSLNLTPFVGGAPVGALVFTETGTLPAGLILNASTGVVSGTPTTGGSVAITYTVSDGSVTTSNAATPYSVAGASLPTQFVDCSLAAIFAPPDADDWYQGLQFIPLSNITGINDTVAPSVPLGVTVTGTSAAWTIHILGPQDPQPGSSGLKDIGFYRDASLINRTAVASVGVQTPLTAQDIGHVNVAGVSTQQANGVDWTQVVEGLGIGQPPDSFHFLSLPIPLSTGLKITDKIHSFAQAGAGAGGGALKYHPGHYARSAQFQGVTLASEQELFDEIDLMAAAVDSNGNPQFLGYDLVLPWSSVETGTQGVYNQSTLQLIDDILTRLTTGYAVNGVTHPFRLILSMWWGSGSSSPTTDFPQYLVNGISGLGSDVLPIGSNWAAAWYRLPVMAVWNAMWNMLGAKYDSNPYFELINPGDETATYFTASDFGPAAAEAAISSMITALTTSWPTTIKSVRCNYMANGSITDVDTVMASLYSHGWAGGGPDLLTPGSAFGESDGELAFRGASPAGIDHRGLMPFFISVEADVYLWTNQTSAGDESYAFTSLKPTHISWIIIPAPAVNGNSSQWWQTGTVPALQAVNFRVAATALSCPTSFGGMCNISGASGNPLAKAGVMFRQSSLANDLYVAGFMYPTPTGHGFALEYRNVVGAFSQQILVPGITAPQWCELVYAGNGVWNLYKSTDSNNFTLVGSCSVPMSGTVLAGLAAASVQPSVTVTVVHKNLAISTAANDSISYTDSPSAGVHTYTLTARDLSLNESAQGAGVVVGGTTNNLSRTLYSAVDSGGFLGTGTFTSGSFTPANNSLLVIPIYGVTNYGSSDPSGNFTITDSQGLTWTRRIYAGNAGNGGSIWAQGIAVFTAPISTGVAMTVTIGSSGTNMYEMWACPFSFTGYLVATPTGVTAANGSGPTTGSFALTLSGAPQANSEVLGFLMTDCSSGSSNPTHGSTFTEIFNQLSGTTEVEYRDNNISTTVDWAAVTTGAALNVSIGCALEIKSS